MTASRASSASGSIPRIHARWQLVLLFLVAALGSLQASPNVLFIYLDDFGWKDTGSMGSDFYETPNLDRIAAEGMVFSQAYSCAANCAPARACLLSGQYTPRHGIYNVGTGPRGNIKHRKLLHVPGTDALDPGIRTWAHLIREAGYVTALIGKWHLSGDPRPSGFDINIGGSHGGSPPRGYYPPHPGAPGLEHAPDNEYLTDRLSAEADAFIRRHRDNPWLLYLTHFAVHTPLDARRDLRPKYEQKPKGRLHDNVAMATMIQSVDEGVGKLLATLEELDLAGNTIVILYSDNGGHRGATDMAPLRGYKGTYYEGGIRVPLFVKWPGRIEPRSRSDEPVTGVDLFPTLIEMTGARLPKSQPLDGLSLVPLLTGGAAALPERPLFWHFPAYLEGGPRQGSESRDILFRSRPCGIIRLGDWKLHQYFEDNGLELYNLRDDIGETNNLAGREPEKRDQLLTRLSQWQRSINAPVPSTPNPDDDSGSETAALKRSAGD